tara:strand:- start:3527 stop:4363 length:837 start_codon:yes stop_codon:yes gene_type:complete
VERGISYYKFKERLKPYFKFEVISHILIIFITVLNGKKIVVVLPVSNAVLTVGKTYTEISMYLLDVVIIVDDVSKNNTSSIPRELDIEYVIRHEYSKGYGGNQKVCYAMAFSLGAYNIIMLNPDYQYPPKLIYAISGIIAYGIYPFVSRARILGKGALKVGILAYKFIANRILTLSQNIIMGQKISEYHTGNRSISEDIFKTISIHNNSDDFIFENQRLAQICSAVHEIGEVICPTNHFKATSSINFTRSITFGLGVIKTSLLFRLAKWKIFTHKIFK